MNLNSILFIILIHFVVIHPAQSKSSVSPNAVSVELNSIEVLMKNSDFSKANQLIKSIDQNTLIALDQVRYFFFKGMLAFEEKNYLDALENYKIAKKKLKFLNQKFEVDYLTPIETFMAQSYFALGKFESAISTLSRQKMRSEKSFLVLSSSYWSLDKKSKAFELLRTALKQFPRSSSLIKQNAIYYSELGLLHELYLEGEKLLSKASEYDQVYFLFLVNLLKQKKELLLAKKLLEQRIALQPKDADATSELAYIYFSENKFYAAKELYLRAAQLDQKYSHQAAEVLLKNNDLSLAKYYNSFVLDQKKKTKQRFAIELKLSNYNEAYILKDELNRQGLLQDESLLYALAYCAIKIGKIESSNTYLNQIKSPEMFKKALRLKDWSKECQNEGAWKCVI